VLLCSLSCTSKKGSRPPGRTPGAGVQSPQHKVPFARKTKTGAAWRHTQHSAVTRGCRVSPRPASYFLLLRQMKVTKEKASPVRRPCGVPCATRPQRGLRNSALRASDSPRPLSVVPCVARRRTGQEGWLPWREFGEQRPLPGLRCAPSRLQPRRLGTRCPTSWPEPCIRYWAETRRCVIKPLSHKALITEGLLNLCSIRPTAHASPGSPGRCLKSQ
jgi:hypothetical protein